MLILGSMPGSASHAAQQYYAHPRNAFWPIMSGLFGLDAGGPYEQRCALLLDRRVAVWDVLEHCMRPGSLDASIDPTSIVANDFRTFFRRHSDIKTVFFNGAAAERLFERQVLATLQGTSAAGLPRIRLPSTSPAHAAMSLQQKQERWEVVRERITEIRSTRDAR